MSTIQLKTGTGSAVPSSLTQGEVAINIDNGLVYYGSGSGNTRKQLESFTHITASGGISASGTITANQINLDDGAKIYFNEASATDQFIQGEDSNILIESDNYLNVNSDIAVNLNTPLVLADGIISGSSLFVTSHVTASGNISASGNIIGRQYQIIDTNFQANISTAPIYMPWTDTDTEKTVTGNKFVNKVAMVPGRPVKTFIRGLNNYDLSGGTSAKVAHSYSMSFWTQEHSGVNTVVWKFSSYTDSLAGAAGNRALLTFDWRNPNSGSATDCLAGDKIWLKLESTNDFLGTFIVSNLFEWDYNG